MTMTAAVFLGVLVLTLLLGACAGRTVRDIRGYYVAGANAGPLLLVGTFLASNVSAALFLGATNEAARVGYAFWCAYVPTAIGFLLCLGWMGPAVRRLARAREIYTFPEILGARFPTRSGSLRLLAALCIPALYLPYVAAQLDGVAAVVGRIEQAFGLERTTKWDCPWPTSMENQPCWIYLSRRLSALGVVRSALICARVRCPHSLPTPQG